MSIPNCETNEYLIELKAQNNKASMRTFKGGMNKKTYDYRCLPYLASQAFVAC